MSEVKPQLVWLPDGFGGGEHVHVYRASDYDALTGRYECNTAIMRARTKALDRVTAERDEALAELAALKGGQVAVAMIRYARGVPGFENEMPHVVSCNDLPDGLYPVYLAPPAQASEWVPFDLKDIHDALAAAHSAIVYQGKSTSYEYALGKVSKALHAVSLALPVTENKYHE